MERLNIRLMEEIRKMSDEEWKRYKTKNIYVAEEKFVKLMKDIGIPRNILGYEYFKQAIIICIANPLILNNMTNGLYPEVAKKFNARPVNVDRMMRHAIEVAFDRGNIEVLHEIFRHTISPRTGRPNNSEFIAMLVEYINYN